MSNLTDLMSKATRGVESATTEQLDADVLRGSRARSRRRRFTAAGVGIGMTAAATATAIVIGLGTGAPVSTGNYAGSSSGGVVGASVTLVNYVGAQPEGFTLDKVPSEWRVLTSNVSSLALGNADDDGSADTAPGMASVEGRIAISVTRAESIPQTLEGRSLAVGDETATVFELLGTNDEPDGTVLVTLPVSEERFLSIQLPPTLNWSDEQVAQFVAGVHVTDAAQTTAG